MERWLTGGMTTSNNTSNGSALLKRERERERWLTGGRTTSNNTSNGSANDGTIALSVRRVHQEAIMGMEEEEEEEEEDCGSEILPPVSTNASNTCLDGLACESVPMPMSVSMPIYYNVHMYDYVHPELTLCETCKATRMGMGMGVWKWA